MSAKGVAACCAALLFFGVDSVLAVPLPDLLHPSAQTTKSASASKLFNQVFCFIRGPPQFLLKLERKNCNRQDAKSAKKKKKCSVRMTFQLLSLGALGALAVSKGRR